MAFCNYRGGPGSDCDGDSDSNDENNWRNEYPDEDDDDEDEEYNKFAYDEEYDDEDFGLGRKMRLSDEGSVRSKIKDKILDLRSSDNPSRKITYQV